MFVRLFFLVLDCLHWNPLPTGFNWGLLRSWAPAGFPYLKSLSTGFMGFSIGDPTGYPIRYCIGFLYGIHIVYRMYHM